VNDKFGILLLIKDKILVQKILIYEYLTQ